jgi:hypothetical protein
LGTNPWCVGSAASCPSSITPARKMVTQARRVGAGSPAGWGAAAPLSRKCVSFDPSPPPCPQQRQGQRLLLSGSGAAGLCVPLAPQRFVSPAAPFARGTCSGLLCRRSNTEGPWAPRVRIFRGRRPWRKRRPAHTATAGVRLGVFWTSIR